MTTLESHHPLSAEAADKIAHDVLGAADTLDADAFVAHFADDTQFRWGGADLLRGKDAVRAAISGFWTSANITGMRHNIKSVCTGLEGTSDVVSVEADTIYTRGDGNVITVPVNSTMRLRDGLIVDYRIFGDASPVFA